jgi:hypothetical protein
MLGDGTYRAPRSDMNCRALQTPSQDVREAFMRALVGRKSRYYVSGFGVRVTGLILMRLA